MNSTLLKENVAFQKNEANLFVEGREGGVLKTERY